MASKKKDQMTDSQFKKAIDALKNIKTAIRGGRPPIIIENKQKELEKKSCRKFRQNNHQERSN